MRFLLSLIALLVFIPNTHSQDAFKFDDLPFLGSAVPVAGECATTDTALAHDIFLEGWQGTVWAPELTWTTNAANSAVTFNPAADTTSLTTGKPTGACNKALQVAVLSVDGTEESSIQHDYGSTIDLDAPQSVDVVFYIYVSEAPGNAENFNIFSCGASSGGGNTSCYIGINQSGATTQIRGVGAGFGAFQSLTANSWNKVALHIDSSTTGTLSTIALNDGAAGGNFDRVSAKDVRYFLFGAVQNLDANDNATYYLDVIAVNTP